MEVPHAKDQFLALYDECADAIYRYCYFRTSSRELAQDLMQETFYKTWNYLTQGKEIENPKAFLYKTAGNMVIDHYRRKKESSLEVLAEAGFDPAGDDEQTTIDYAAGKEAIAAIKELPSEYRHIITLRYVNDLSIGEIAAAEGISENAVSVRIHRGVEKLKKLLSV